MQRFASPRAAGWGIMGRMRIKAVALLFVFLGCGGNDGGPIPVGDLEGRLAEALCQRDVRCGLLESISVCMAIVDHGINASEVVAAVNDGTAKYDAAKAGECVAAYAARSCDRSAEPPCPVPTRPIRSADARASG